MKPKVPTKRFKLEDIEKMNRQTLLLIMNGLLLVCAMFLGGLVTYYKKDRHKENRDYLDIYNMPIG